MTNRVIIKLLDVNPSNVLLGYDDRPLLADFGLARLLQTAPTPGSTPIPPGDPLLALSELVLTPHNGGMTREVIDNGVLRAVENIQLFLTGRPRDLVVPPPGR